MTVPSERYRALVAAKEFMYDLLNSQETPRVPLIIRKRARTVLKHYPSFYDIEELARRVPQILEYPKEDKK